MSDDSVDSFLLHLLHLELDKAIHYGKDIHMRDGIRRKNDIIEIVTLERYSSQVTHV